MKKIDYHLPFYKGHFYHVYNRGVGHEPIFYCKENYRFFLSRYIKFLSEVTETYAFCLLPNHFHFLIKIINENPDIISQSFRKLFISYSMALNKQQERRGDLFQRNFKRKTIEQERYLYRVVYYIHSNPVHHNITDDFKDYHFSSYRIVSSDKPTHLKRKEVLDWFGGIENFIDFHKTLHKFDFADIAIEE